VNYPRLTIEYRDFHCMPIPNCSTMASVLQGGFVVAPFRPLLGLGVLPPVGEWFSLEGSVYRVSNLFYRSTSSLLMILVMSF
jgi:hypothetical protein